VNSIVTFFQAIGIAYAAGLNVYATVAVVGLAERFGWIPEIPDTLAWFGSPWIIAASVALVSIEFVATLVPGIASAWETVHSLIRPPTAAALAAGTAWHGDPLFVLLAALAGGIVAVTTHVTKLGLRYAIESSPEPITNGVANIAELSIITALVLSVWHHPFISVGIALLLLITLVITVRLIWRVLRQVFSGHWMPRRGFLQSARTTTERVLPPQDDL
jgi:hypothetical protein